MLCVGYIVKKKLLYFWGKRINFPKTYPVTNWDMFTCLVAS